MAALLDTVQRLQLFDDGESVLVAVSGGADSVALLDLLAKLPLKLAVAHLNHCLRGAESDGDEAFVAELAAGYRLPFLSRRVDVAALARELRLSLEDAGRKARYDFFAETADRIGAASIALAHHANDQAETVLMRLLRGAGGSGLSAMRQSQGRLKRPLLQVAREEIEEYLKERGLKWRCDSTNDDVAFLRNSIRHELIPFLKRYNPAVVRSLCGCAQSLAADEELLERLTDEAFCRSGAFRDGAAELDCRDIAGEPKGMRLRLYRRALQDVRGDLQRIGRTHLEAIDALVFSGRPNARLNLPEGLCVQRRYDRVYFLPFRQAPQKGWALEIAGEGEHELPVGGRLSVRRMTRPDVVDPGSRAVAYLSPDHAPFPWRVRGFLPGDRIRPLGMAGEQKVKDVFINDKIPQEKRRRLPLLFSAGKLLWIAGVRMGETAAVRGDETTVLRAEILDFTP